MNDISAGHAELPRGAYFNHTLRRARTAAEQRSHRYVTLEHLLFALLDDPDALAILREMGADVAVIQSTIGEAVNYRMASLAVPDGRAPTFSYKFDSLMVSASESAVRAGRGEIDGGLAIIALARDPESNASAILTRNGFDPIAALQGLGISADHEAQPLSPPAPFAPVPSLQARMDSYSEHPLPSFEPPAPGPALQGQRLHDQTHSPDPRHEISRPAAGQFPESLSVPSRDDSMEEMLLSVRNILEAEERRDRGIPRANSIGGQPLSASREPLQAEPRFDRDPDGRDRVSQRGETDLHAAGRMQEPDWADPNANVRGIPPLSVLREPLQAEPRFDRDADGRDRVSQRGEADLHAIGGMRGQDWADPRASARGVPPLSMPREPLQAEPRFDRDMDGQDRVSQRAETDLHAIGGMQGQDRGGPNANARGVPPLSVPQPPQAEPRFDRSMGGRGRPPQPAEAQYYEPGGAQGRERAGPRLSQTQASSFEEQAEDLSFDAPPAVDAPPKARRKGRAAKGTRASETPAFVTSLLEHIPRRMLAGTPETLEVRMSKEETAALFDALNGRGQPQTEPQLITRAVTVRLGAPEGGFFIETLTPETQWLFDRPSFLGDEVFGRWIWTLIPSESGKHKLLLHMSSRMIDENGLPRDLALPPQTVEVGVRRSFASLFGYLVKTALLLLAGSGLTIGVYYVLKMLGKIPH